ncbi:MAG TPA: GNAT family N-acetyltransferase [Candidatus Cloacimonetes bacterium]|nr:GNAT family N-acetyltransferase [Candidatus Cloacimonadota bacterium]HEX37313.1 GNAT family N-acetyltransferase [Candidatus Cloacimonadota bacterium]
MGNKNISSLHLPVSLKYLPAAQAYIEELGRLVNFSRKDITLFNVAVEEAITNVIKHAFLPEQEEHFDILCEINSIEFKVIIRDKGLPFDPNRVEEFSAEQSLEGIEQRGLGFKLMKGSVDKISFHNLGYGGKEVRLIKFVDQKHIDEYFKESQMEAYEEPTHIDKKNLVKILFTTMLLKPEQAIEISQCAYRTYGYTYFMENIYYPERLIEMNKTGELICSVAVTDETNEVMGHAALEFLGKRSKVPELGMAFTKPKFRGQGCMTRLNELLDELAGKRGIKGIMADAVTTHPFSQKALHKCGYKACGIRLAMDPPKTFKGMKDQGTQRESMIIVYKKLVDQDVEIYAPMHHKSMIEKIYNNIGLDAIINTPKNLKEEKDKFVQSDIEVEVMESIAWACLYVNAVGKYFEEEIKQRVRELCMKKIEVIELQIDMCDNNLMKCVPQLEMFGFFFAGVLPDDDKQFLVLQYLNNVPIDYDKIVCAFEFSQELKAYVKNCDPNQM